MLEIELTESCLDASLTVAENRKWKIGLSLYVDLAYKWAYSLLRLVRESRYNVCCCLQFWYIEYLMKVDVCCLMFAVLMCTIGRMIWYSC